MQKKYVERDFVQPSITKHESDDNKSENDNIEEPEIDNLMGNKVHEFEEDSDEEEVINEEEEDTEEDEESDKEEETDNEEDTEAVYHYMVKINRYIESEYSCIKKIIYMSDFKVMLQ